MVVSLLGKVIPSPIKRKLQEVRNHYYGKSFKRIFLLEICPRPVRNALVSGYYTNFKSKIVSDWEKAGKPVPPPHTIKQMTIQEYQAKYNCSTLVETGTYLGDMLMAQRTYFNKLYSIEISEPLWKEAVGRFKKYKHIEILLGDSGEVLKKLVPQLKEKAVFWLDGHYSAGITETGEKICPIYAEIDAIFDLSPINHVLLIDDARLFERNEHYPTIKELADYVKSKNPNYQLEVKNDLIRFVIPQ